MTFRGTLITTTTATIITGTTTTTTVTIISHQLDEMKTTTDQPLFFDHFIKLKICLTVTQKKFLHHLKVHLKNKIDPKPKTENQN